MSLQSGGHKPRSEITQERVRMIRLMSSTAPPPFVTVVHPRAALAGRDAELAAFVRHSRPTCR